MAFCVARQLGPVSQSVKGACSPASNDGFATHQERLEHHQTGTKESISTYSVLSLSPMPCRPLLGGGEMLENGTSRTQVSKPPKSNDWVFSSGPGPSQLMWIRPRSQ